MSTSQEQELRLQQEILAEANKKAERIIARAHADCQNAVKQADTENAKRRDAALAEAQANADRRSRSIVRGIWMECRRRWLEERERRMNQCFDEVLGNAVAIPAADPRRANSLAALAKEAIAGLQGWVDCFEKAKLVKVLSGGGLNDPADAEANESYLKAAYELGKNI